MKKLMWLPAILMLFYGLPLQAQQTDSLAQRNAGKTDAALSATPQQQAASDTTGTASAAPAPSAANTVISQTSSQSGSPAVLSGNSGSDRDGTNNVQRATMNMVGSPAGNLELDGETVDADTEMQDRQAYTQDKKTSAKNQNGSTAQPSAAKSDEINDKTRRENNDQSDQNLSARDKKNGKAEIEPESESRKQSDSKKKKRKG